MWSGPVSLRHFANLRLPTSMASLRSLGVGALFVSLGLGCAAGAVVTESGSSSTTPSNADPAQFCSTYCNRVSVCDNTRDQQTCQNLCANQNAATVPKLRADVVKLIQDCFGQKDCKTVLGSDVVATCSTEAVASVAPTAVATQLCDSLVSAETKCGHAQEKATCLNRAKLYSDKTLNDALTCTGKACTDIDTCMDASLGTTSATPGPGPGPGPGQDSACGYSNLSSCLTGHQTQCYSALQAGAADSYCSALESCKSSCARGSTGSSCRSQCATQYPSSLAAPLDACVVSKCCTECPP